MRWTNSKVTTVILLASLAGLVSCAYQALPDQGQVHVERWGTIRAADKDVSEILAAFNEAEAALHSKNLDGLMALYSDQYKYHGLSKADLRKMWQELFEQYDHLASHHIFSRLQVVVSGKNPTAEIVCTGNLFGISKETGERTIIDSWFYENHHLAYENGGWRILGHGAEAPKALRFGSSPHPFF
jgi:ketosteroid isomerase-like protein